MINFPKFNLLYYKNLLDICFCRFFDLYNSSFINDNGTYILAENITKSKLSSIFRSLLKEELLKCVTKMDSISPNYYFIIGACLPKDNILFQYRDKDRFPKKLEKITTADYQLKYILKEHDIKLDLILFNQIATDIFDELFLDERKVLRMLGKEYRNVLFIKHKNLDCYSMFKAIKWIYGKSNCTNLYLEKFKNQHSPIVAVNELIDRYVHSKTIVNKSKEFKQYIAEIQQFVSEKIAHVRN